MIGPPDLPASQSDNTKEQQPDDDDLGYYNDGVQRTLTDDQVAMFRNSEVQRLLADRRRAKEQEEEQKQEKEEKYRARSRKRHRPESSQAQQGKNESGYRTVPDVESLIYEDEPVAVDRSKTFQWPKLG